MIQLTKDHSMVGKLVRLGLITAEDARVHPNKNVLLKAVGRTPHPILSTVLYVAMGWVAGPTAACPVRLRDEGARRSGYTTRALLSHFVHLVLSSGTRALRMVSGLGVLFALGGIAYAIYLLVVRVTSNAIPQGWTSTMVLVLLSTGAILFSLGVIAEYVGVAVSMAMGKPLYLIVGDPKDGPLGRAGQSGTGPS